MLSPTARLADPDQNVVLTGFMGTGKSTSGRRLARRLGFEFVDTDHLIESSHGPIDEIFARRGELGFREIERDTVAALATARRHVISTGGGTMIDPGGERILGGSGRVFCLTASPESILERVTTSRSGVVRPLLDGPDPSGRICELLAERLPRYRRFPRLRTDGRNTESVAEELETLVTTRPTIVNQRGRTIVVGIGVAARAAALLADMETTVIDVGRIQPNRSLDAATLVSMQHTVISQLLPT